MTSTREEPTLGAGAGADAPAIDAMVALANVGGDRHLLQEVVELYVQDEPRMLADLEEAVRGRRAVDVHRCAHALKGSVAVLGATGARALALELESLGREGSVEGAALLLDTLRVELEKLDGALRTLIEGPRA